MSVLYSLSYTPGLLQIACVYILFTLIMEVINPFWTFYNLYDRMKNNDQQCPHIKQRMKALEQLVLFIQHEMPEPLSDDVKEALEKLSKTMITAAAVVTKFMETHKLNQMVKSIDYKSEFDSLNKSLTDAFVTLSVALHVYQEKKLDEQKIKLTKQEKKLDEQEIELAKQEKKLDEQEIKLAKQEKKLDEQEIKLAKQEKKLDKQEIMLTEQEKKVEEQEIKLAKQEKKLDKQEIMLTEQEKKLDEQEIKLVMQEKNLAEQKNKIAEQEDILQRVESQLYNQTRGYYCTLQ
ncbi:putative golgin subfamily A member 6-like protein 19 [Paralichthys olivaceus]|uniref:putative golgin subfamily A member 6-like protein 19 n=1 Tax=Paralichthys olivaceus TaxID=8255 RepID=UPI003752FEAE